MISDFIKACQCQSRCFGPDLDKICNSFTDWSLSLVRMYKHNRGCFDTVLLFLIFLAKIYYKRSYAMQYAKFHIYYYRPNFSKLSNLFIDT